MDPRPIDLEGLHDLLADPTSLPDPPFVLVDLDASVASVQVHNGIPLVIVGLTSADEPLAHPAARACDVVLHDGDVALEAVRTTVQEHPIAATALALLLRGASTRALEDGLLVESAVYSTLQGGSEFAQWRAGRAPRARPEQGPTVVLERSAGCLDVTLNRPHVRNALNTAMRDELVEAFRLVALDGSITEVHLRGAGASFCAGGDLDEFGSFPDPATAHVVRLLQSVGRAIAEVADRVTVHLHGACYGSGIELPAFAGTVVAAPDTLIGLPEVALGLVPGAGGTVSLPRRIGRHRTARLALTGERLDATTALAWGLVDAIEPSSGPYAA